MKLEYVVLFLILITIPILAGLLTMIPVIVLHSKREKQSPASPRCVSIEIVGSVPTNNTYSQLQETFTMLEEKLAERDLKLHINLEGYTSGVYKQ